MATKFTADMFVIVGCGVGAVISFRFQRLWIFGVLGGGILLIDFMTDWP